MTTLGQRIKQRRLELELEQEALAKAVGFSQPTLANLERGKNERTKYLAELAKALKTTSEWLSTGKGDKEAVPEAIKFTELNGLEAQLVMVYRGLSGSQKDRLLLIANQIAIESEPEKATAKNPFPKRRVTDYKGAVEKHAEVAHEALNPKSSRRNTK
jgi:transcriptional regulator with XRE-family HTH domain